MPATTAEGDTIYDRIIADFRREKNAWCKNAFHNGMSACLVGGVERATGVAYVKPDGTTFATKDRRKVVRAARIVNHLAELINPNAKYDDAPEDVNDLPDDEDIAEGDVGCRNASGADPVVGFNDAEGTKKADVIRLLKKAARKFPND